MKMLKANGFSIQPEKVNKLPPGESIVMTITYTTKKNQKFGNTRTVVPFDIKSGPRYCLDL
jgi:hypothetical protein